MEEKILGDEIRKFIKFFTDKRHKQFESASLIRMIYIAFNCCRYGYTNIFLGQKEAPCPRVTTYQKCIRTNEDLENVDA